MYIWEDGELVTAAKLNAYGEGMEQLKADAESAKTAAESAKTAAESAKTAAAGSAEEAASSKEAAEAAKTGAESAKTAAAGSASSAESAKTAAESAKTAAESAKTAATSSATEAASSKEAAEEANSSAQSAKTSAETAAQSAEAAKTNAAGSASSAAADAQRAEDAVAHNPTVQNGIWYVWNPETGSYVSTGVPATGEMTVEVTYQQGDSATTPPTGAWIASPPEVAQGKYLWTKTLFSDGTTGYSVARQGMDGTGSVVSVNGKSGAVTLTTDDVSEGAKKYVSTSEKSKIGNLPDDTVGTFVSAQEWATAEFAKKITKVSNATAGNIPTLTADGQLVDSGKKPSDLGGGIGAFIATYESTTYEEIKEAYEAQTPVVCFCDANVTATTKVEFRLHAITEEQAIFVGMESAYSDLRVDFLLCSSDSEWTMDFAFLLPAPLTTHKGYILAVNDSGDWEITKPPFALKPATITGTLTAGSTSLVLSNSAITTNSTIDIYTDKWGVNPTDVVVEAEKVTLTFEAQAAALAVKVEVR